MVGERMRLALTFYHNMKDKDIMKKLNSKLADVVPFVNFPIEAEHAIRCLTMAFLLFISTGSLCAKETDGNNVDVVSLMKIGLPVVEIETVNGEWPTYEVSEKPEGCWGSGITNATKVPSRMRIYVDGKVAYDSGEYEKGQSGLTVKIRGNSSAQTAKKPYKLKLQKKADLLMRGNDDVYKDKDWLLYKDDKSMSLNTMIGLKVNELIGMSWTPDFRFVNVVINEDYQGVYMLLESVDRNPDCRINVDKDSGYILEYDAYWWNEDLCLKEGLFYQYGPLRYTFKYPDSQDLKPEQLDYIQGAVQAMEKSVLDGSYPDYIDVESFAAWVLAHDILGTFDGGGSNIFLTKYDETPDSKFAMANLWDFDTIERCKDQWGSEHTMPIFYYKTLFESPNKTFVRSYVNLWGDVKETLFDDMERFLEDFAASDDAQALDASLVLDGKRWGKNVPSVNDNVFNAKQWFSDRKAWMEHAMIPVLESTEVVSLSASSPFPMENSFYNVLGQRVNPSVPGLLVRKGNKFFNVPLRQ